MLRVYLLGAPRIERDGAAVRVDTRKAVALLAYLALEDGPHGRDTLAGLLWPESDTEHSRAALRRTLSALNKAIGGIGLQAGRHSVGLERSPDIWLDIDEFRDHVAEAGEHEHLSLETCAVCTPVLGEAASIYGDDFMAGFALRDSAEFDDWHFYQSEALQRELAGVLERLVQSHGVQGDYEAAVSHARRWLALDTLHEPAHRALMKLHAWSGQRSAALRQYRECVRVLQNELGVSPLEETTQLYEAIKENRVELPKELRHEGRATTSPKDPRHAAGTATGPASLPLIGRSSELETMLEAFEAIGEEGRLVVLEGEPGIGKTRLAAAFIDEVRSRGGVALGSRCYQGESGLSFAPFIECLRAAVQRPGWPAKLPAAWASEAARLLPELSGAPGAGASPPQALDDPGAQSRFFEGLSQAIIAAVGQRGVLFIDDVHWADGASLELLAYLVRRLREKPICVLLTLRTEEAQSLPLLIGTLAESHRSGSATRIPLERLDVSHVAELVRSARSLGLAAPEDLESTLHAETEGLPFFVVEYLASAVNPAGVEGAAPVGVRELLHSRLAVVNETGQQLLGTAAVIGRSFSFDILRAASGRGEEETVASLELLTAQGLVHAVDGEDRHARAMYDFSHERLRALVYDETSLARRRLLHRRVAQALTLGWTGRREGPALSSRIAHHYQLAGLEADAAVHYKLAGEHAQSLYANADALEHLRAALAMGHPDTAGIQQTIGDLQTLSGEYAAAIASYEAAAAMSENGSPAVIEHKLGNVHHRRGDWAMAESQFESSAAALGEGGPPGPKARVYADWSLTAHRKNDSERALSLARVALQLAETAGDSSALAQAHNILGILAKSRGDLPGAVSHLERSLDLAGGLGEHSSARVAALNNLALARAAQGEEDGALEMLQEALRACTSQGDRHREAALHNNIADVLHGRGEAEPAMTHLKEAVAIFADIGKESGTFEPEIWKLVEW